MIAWHGGYIRIVAIIAQLNIEHGEPLYSVEHDDPDDDDKY
jgi:hypothetical protein